MLEPDERGGSAARTGYVLLVDDDAELREALAELLRSEGFEVREAEHGRAALEVLAVDPSASLIVLDLTMPVMGGREFIATQRSNTSIAEIPVLLITAADDDSIARSLATAFVRKPIPFDDILERIQSLLSRPATSR